MKTIIAILYAKLIRKRNQNWITNPIKYQNKTFHKLISKAKKLNLEQTMAFQKFYHMKHLNKMFLLETMKG